MPLFIDLYDSSPSPAVTYRVSDEHITATDPHNSAGEEYLPLLIELGEVRIAQQYIHGGLVRPEYGGLVVSPEVFAASWPPPVTLDCWVSYVAPGASPSATPGGDVLVAARAHLASWNGREVRYDMVSQPHPDEVENVVIVGGLDDVCTEYASSLILPDTVTMSGLLSYSGRSPAPAVNYRVEGARSILGVLGDIAAFFTHRIVISPTGGATMTDTTQPVGTALFLYSRDVVDITYLRGDRYRRYEAAYSQPFIRNIELRIGEAGTCNDIFLAEADVAKAIGGALSNPSGVAARMIYNPTGADVGDPSQPGYPVSHLIDNTQSTYWATWSDTINEVDPYSICLQMAVASGTIAEYALTSRNTAPYCAPTRWDLYGYDVNRSRYQYISTVESPNWGSAEQRRFAVPAGANWPVQVDGDYGATDTWTAPLVGNQASYATIFIALGLIKTLTEQERVRVTLPMGLGVLPHIGQHIGLYDNTTPAETSAYFVAASLTYNFVDQLIVAEGPGGITSR